LSLRFPAAVAAAWVLASVPASAAEGDRFRALSVGVSGGFQSWGLESLERTLDDRSAQFGELGFVPLGKGFGATYSYGVEIQGRLTETFLFRVQADWTRMKIEYRDRRSLAELGAPSRDAFSLYYESRVKSRPLVFALGAGAARELRSLRIGLFGNVLIAPLELEDTVVLARGDAEEETQLTSTGTGTGFEADLAVDWFTDVRTNLFLEVFWRTGSTTVSLDQAGWESSLFPGERRIDLDAVGLRAGFRWI
jgi:hypothetical protein